jgi:hypothetical protein
MALTLRAVKGSNLTPTEADSSLKTAAGPQPVGVAAGRALSAADSHEPINYTGAAAATFTVPAGLGATLCEFEVIKGGAGVPTITVAAGVTLNGIDGGSAAVGSTYSSVKIRALALNTFHIVSA